MYLSVHASNEFHHLQLSGIDKTEGIPHHKQDTQRQFFFAGSIKKRRNKAVLDPVDTSS